MLRRAAVLALVSALLLPTGPARAGEDPMLGAPDRGDCYDLSVRQVDGYDTPEETVPCSEDHTVLVTGVGRLPDGVGWGQENRVQQAVADQCPPTWWKVVGSRDSLTWFRSAYQAWWLAPGEADRDGGARWFSCLITVLTGRGLVDLPRHLPQISKRKIPDSVAKCVTSERRTTICSEPHTWRSSYAFYARGEMTDRSVQSAAQRTCPRHVTSRKYLFSARDAAGNRFIVGCYSKTSR